MRPFVIENPEALDFTAPAAPAVLPDDMPQSGVSRRGFLKSSALVGGGLMVGFFVPVKLSRLAAAHAQETAPPGGSVEVHTAALPPANAFLRVGSDDSITVLLSHAEMGQGIWTTLPMLVNEELDADWSRFRVEHAPTAAVYRSTAFPIQMTGGSTSTWSEFDRYRQVGAVTRTLLVAAAAAAWHVAPGDCHVDKGFVVCGARRASYGSLAEAAAKLPAPASVALKPAAQWKVIGQPTRRLDTPEKITGRALFGLDVRLPGMLTAVVAHAPTFGGKVKSVDAAAARQVAGVRAVFEVPTGVAVVADHYWAAKVGRDALRIDWDLGPHAALDTTEIRRAFAEQAKTPGLTAAAGGDAAKALAGGASAGHRVLSADYHVPYLAHAPMEPLNCTVQRTAEGCEVWTGTQFQTVDQQRVAAIFEVKPEQVNVHTTFLGGGFGRRANVNSDFVVEAAHVAKGAEAAGVFKGAHGAQGADQVNGAQGAGQVKALPIKLVWPREDDIRGGYYRPMALHRLQGAVDAKGEPVAWRQNIVTQSILGGSPFAAMMKDGIDPTCVEGASDSPYVTAIPHHRVALNVATLGVPVLWWRSVGNSHTAFAVESFVDEMAHAAKRDPLEFRLALLRKAPRVRAVLALAAEKAGWGTAPPAGRARGLAVHESFGSIVAQVAEVSVHGSRIQVHRVVAAVDCGICVNPLGVGAQIESAVAFGLGAALHSEVTMKDGRVVESNFHDYRVLRLHEMPHVEVHIVPSREKSGGVGEPGTPPIAPAVANAVFALTGKRLRELPFQLA